MNLDKIIKRQTLSLMVIVITLIIFISSVMYILFFEIDNYSESKNDFEIEFCIDKSCENKYYNYNNLIGTSRMNDKVVLRKINNYDNRLYAILEEPYVFTIKNNIKDSTIGIAINLREDYLKDNTYKKYLNNVYIAICEKNKELLITRYEDIDGYLLNNININNNEEKTYYIWLWTEDSKYSFDQYFVASIEINNVN
ncbi:MAG: hypothetical protein ACI33S_00065 [Bacilli bacterium]